MGPPGRPSCLPPRVPTFQPHLPNTHKPTIELSFPSGPCDSLDLARTDSKILGGQRASHTFPAHCPPSRLTYCMCVTGALRRRRQGWAPSWSCTSLACLISRPGNHHCNPPLSSQGPHSTIPPLSPGQQQGTCLGGGLLKRLTRGPLPHPGSFLLSQAGLGGSPGTGHPLVERQHLCVPPVLAGDGGCYVTGLSAHDLHFLSVEALGDMTAE